MTTSLAVEGKPKQILSQKKLETSVVTARTAIK